MIYRRFESVKQQLERYYWVSIYWETDYNHTDAYIINAPHIQMFCLIEYKDKWDDFNYLTFQVMNTIEILGFFFHSDWQLWLIRFDL